MSPFADVQLLGHLARLYGVQTAYYDVCHRRQQASPESMLAVLRALGAPVPAIRDVPAAWEERREAIWQRLLEPVIVAWDGGPPAVQLRLPSVMAGSLLSCRLKLESGEQRRWECSGADLPVVEAAEIKGARYVSQRFNLPAALPLGYHLLLVEIAGKIQETLIIAAPLKAYVPTPEPEDRKWGVFLPLYALHTKRSWGGGDLSDLAELMEWVGGRGGNVLATLPLLATFPHDFSEPSPYLPASRLLWNEFYLDVNSVPELPECPTAQALLASSSFQGEIEALRKLTLVDYQRQMALKRRILQELSGCFFTRGSRRREELERFIKANPVVDDYARFRAACEERGTPWRSWPQLLRDGTLRRGDYGEEDRNYHVYVQWLAHQQIESISGEARKTGIKLYLDLPLGVHPDGYDVWRERGAFLLNVATGSPPDTVFTRGQNWEFPPLHPEAIREQGYRYMIAYLRHHLRRAGILRIDHAMGLHRLFCIPDGMEASQGVYLRYPAEELYAVLALESHRSQTIVVGEDLGTVPPYVRPAMNRHGLHRMYVLHYELAAQTRKGFPSAPPNSVASLNTHDMPPFASFWQGTDIEERWKLGLLREESRRGEKKIHRNIIKSFGAFLRRKGWLAESASDILAALKASLSFLAESRARIVLVNLEDLWLETQPQNVPTTTTEYPNWRRRARYGFEEFCQMPRVTGTLQIVDALRRRRRQP